VSDHEAECITLKRRGQEFVRRLLAGKSREERLRFWSEQTRRLRAWQQARRTGTTHQDPATCLFQEDPHVEAGLLDPGEVKESDSVSHSV